MAKMQNKRLRNEYIDIIKNPVSNCSAGPIKEDDLTQWRATIIGPSDTPYANGIFDMNIIFTDEYPYKPPKVTFLTPIYHCNINNQGDICLDILKTNWSPSLSISKLLLSICSLLAEPNPKDPLVPEIANLYIKNKTIHDINAKNYTIKYA